MVKTDPCLTLLGPSVDVTMQGHSPPAELFHDVKALYFGTGLFLLILLPTGCSLLSA